MWISHVYLWEFLLVWMVVIILSYWLILESPSFKILSDVSGRGVDILNIENLSRYIWLLSESLFIIFIKRRLLLKRLLDPVQFILLSNLIGNIRIDFRQRLPFLIDDKLFLYLIGVWWFHIDTQNIYFCSEIVSLCPHFFLTSINLRSWF